MGTEMLRCAQHDSAMTHTDAWINLFICIMVESNPTNSVDNAGIDVYNWRIHYCIFCPAVEVPFPWHDHIFLERGLN